MAFRIVERNRYITGRRLAKWALLGCISGALLVIVWAGFYCWKYRVGPLESSRGVIRDIGLYVIRGLVAVFDPSTSRHPELGPKPVDACKTPLETALAKCPLGMFQDLRIQNHHLISSPAAFGYQIFDEPRLYELRHRYHLDEVVAPATSEFDKMVRLREWCRSQFHRADFQREMDQFDVLTILDQDKRNHANAARDVSTQYDPCHFFPLFFVQAATSMGWTARLIGLNNIGNGHGGAEIWSNQYEKWVYMDAELNHHLERHGIPLSAIELVEASVAPWDSQITLKRGKQICDSNKTDPNTTMVHLKKDKLEARDVVPWFKSNISIVDMRNDWMTNAYFRGHPARGEFNSLVFQDARTGKPLEFFARLRPVITNKEEFCWPLNITEIVACKPDCGGSIALGFHTITPNFSHFEVTLDDSQKIVSNSAEFQWKLQRGRNRIAVRSFNQFEIAGVESSAELTWRGQGKP